MNFVSLNIKMCQLECGRSHNKIDIPQMYSKSRPFYKWHKELDQKVAKKGSWSSKTNAAGARNLNIWSETQGPLEARTLGHGCVPWFCAYDCWQNQGYMWVVVRIHGWLSSWLASQSSPAKKWSDCPWATTWSNLCKLLAIEHPWPAKPCTTTPYNRNDSWYVCKTSQIPPLLPDVCQMSPLLWDSSLIGGFQERPESFWLPVLALFEEHHLGSVPSIFPAFSELSESSARLSNHGNLHNKKTSALQAFIWLTEHHSKSASFADTEEVSWLPPLHLFSQSLPVPAPVQCGRSSSWQPQFLYQLPQPA